MQDTIIMNLGSYYLTVGASRKGQRCWLTRAAICSSRTMQVLHGFTCEGKSFHEAVGIAFFEAKQMLENVAGADAVQTAPGELPFLLMSDACERDEDPEPGEDM